MGLWYDSKRDGTIEDYLKWCKEQNVPFAFKGIEPYRALWKKGCIVPEITSLRLCYNHARPDEFYVVAGEHELEGVELQQHSGKKGEHKPEEILTDDAPYWEISNLNPRSIPRC